MIWNHALITWKFIINSKYRYINKWIISNHVLITWKLIINSNI